MADKKQFIFKPIHLLSVVAVTFLAFAAGFAAGDDSGYHRGYHRGETSGVEIGVVKGQLKAHAMWETATSSGTTKPVKEAVKLIEDFVYGQ